MYICDHRISNRARCHIVISTVHLRVDLTDTTQSPLLRLFGHSLCQDNTFTCTLPFRPGIIAGVARVRVSMSRMMIAAVQDPLRTYLTGTML